MHDIESPEHPATRLRDLTHAIVKTEAFALKHCRHEADRLRYAEPANVLLAIAAHAQGTLGALPEVCARDGLPLDGSATDAHLLALRDALTDLLMQDEWAYRSTLEALRRGVALMRLIALSAEGDGKPALAEFSVAWLDTRTALIERAESELRWFSRPRGASNVGEDESSGSE